jgi:L-fuculose-phosphate aldolase
LNTDPHYAQSSAERLRSALVEYGLKLGSSGLSEGSTGNISVRVPEGMLITPSGIAYDLLRPESMVQVALDACGTYHHTLKPSSEWQFHRDIYLARPEVQAIVHGHPVYSTALAIRRMAIPPLHYMIAVAGGKTIPCAPYATFGSEALSQHALMALQGHKACLLANHGMIAVGTDLAEAMRIAIEVEVLAKQYVMTLQLGGPVLLDDEEMDRVLEKFKTYGQQEI